MTPHCHPLAHRRLSFSLLVPGTIPDHYEPDSVLGCVGGGTFADATDEEKGAYAFVVQHLLTAANSQWKKLWDRGLAGKDSARGEYKIWNVVTEADWAIAMMYYSLYREDMFKESKNRQKGRRTVDQRNKELASYNGYYDAVSGLLYRFRENNEPCPWADWDEAYLSAVPKEKETAKSARILDKKTVSQPKKARFRKDLLSLATNTTGV